MALTLVERLAGKDPNGWKEFFPDYEPNDDVRVTKARAVEAGLTPQERASPFDPQSRAAAYQATPLSDSDVALAREATGGRLDLGDVREVPGVSGRNLGTFDSLGDAPAAPPPSNRNQNANTSSGEIVQQDQDAKAEDSNTQNPEPEVAEDSETVADAVEDREDGPALNARTDALSQAGVGVQTQTPLGNEPERQPITASDDEGNESAEDFQDDSESDVIVENVTVPGDFVKRLQPKPNILSEFTSYTYSLSLYLVQPGDYERMMLTGEKKLFNSTLLIQTGGSPVGDKESEKSRRNVYFDDDFYINDLEIESLVTGKSTQGAHNATTLRFNITEPYGISFLDRLRNAVADYRGSDENLFSQIYILVVRFYGYDNAGNLAQPENKPEETTDSNAVIEKFIPFIWENIKFTVSNQSVVYECKAVAVNQYVGLGQLTSTVPYNIEISGQTLSEVVNGETIFSESRSTQDEDDENGINSNNEAQAKKTIKQGLASALNKFEKAEAEKTGSIPNEYVIKLDESVGLSNAKMAQFDEAYLANLPVEPRTTQTLAQKTSNDNTRRKYSVIAGQPIVQVLDLLVRASTYITDQQLVKITEDPAADRGLGPTVERAKKYERLRESQNGPIAWYKITTHTVPKEYDERRKEYAYKITYIVSGYQVNDLASEFFPKPPFRGVHKKYDYWFTGKNTEVLGFEQQYNSLFYIRMAPSEVLSAAGIDPREYRNSTSKGTTQNTSDQSEVMGTGDSARPAADAASSLYSPSDQAIADLKILGDPAWIQQSELLYNNNDGIDYSPFLPDESINYDSQEPLFQISFNLPTDYDVDKTGTMPVRKFNKNDVSGPGSNEYIYRANRIVNSFVNGEFTQQISATLQFDATRDNISSPNRSVDNSSELFPLLGDDIILPGTSSDVGSSKNADVLGPRRGPFGVSGIDVISDNLGSDDD